MELLGLLNELKKVSFEAKVIEEIISEIEPENAEEPMGVGSRMLVKWKTIPHVKGRIYSIGKEGSYYVNRDGYSGLIKLGINKPGLSEHTLEHLSIGYYGKLDRKMWQANNKIHEIQELIRGLIGADSSQMDLLIKKINSL